MSGNVRDPKMMRITSKKMADVFIAEQIAEIKATVKDGRVLLALSGGVDSSVCAALLAKAIGEKLVCVHVNHGLLRKNESEEVIRVFKNELKANLIYVDAADEFLDALAGVEEPEQKRKIIGRLFIEVFKKEAQKLDLDKIPMIKQLVETLSGNEINKINKN